MSDTDVTTTIEPAVDDSTTVDTVIDGVTDAAEDIASTTVQGRICLRQSANLESCTFVKILISRNNKQNVK